MTEDPPKRSKVERLAVACALVPGVRAGAEAASRRLIHRVGNDGKTVGYIDGLSYQKAILARAQIEFDVQLDVRPKKVMCTQCGRPIEVAVSGVPRKKCDDCYHGRCIDCGTLRAGASRGAKHERCFECLRKSWVQAQRYCTCGTRLEARAKTGTCRPCTMQSVAAKGRTEGAKGACVACGGQTSRLFLTRCHGCNLQSRRKTHCKRGHEMSEDNIVRDQSGKRKGCRECSRARARDQQKRAAA